MLLSSLILDGVSKEKLSLVHLLELLLLLRRHSRSPRRLHHHDRRADHARTSASPSPHPVRCLHRALHGGNRVAVAAAHAHEVLATVLHWVSHLDPLPDGVLPLHQDDCLHHVAHEVHERGGAHYRSQRRIVAFDRDVLDAVGDVLQKNQDGDSECPHSSGHLCQHRDLVNGDARTAEGEAALPGALRAHAGLVPLQRHGHGLHHHGLAVRLPHWRSHHRLPNHWCSPHWLHARGVYLLVLSQRLHHDRLRLVARRRAILPSGSIIFVADFLHLQRSLRVVYSCSPNTYNKRNWRTTLRAGRGRPATEVSLSVSVCARA
mmetsp:Transcript_25933/g.65390  ORF Transcript_25933/g.65390 Transcript_25933/m.65390 type:complete len:319 (-) Transcript_25933:64-1020(-)